MKHSTSLPGSIAALRGTAAEAVAAMIAGRVPNEVALVMREVTPAAPVVAAPMAAPAVTTTAMTTTENVVAVMRAAESPAGGGDGEQAAGEAARRAVEPAGAAMTTPTTTAMGASGGSGSSVLGGSTVPGISGAEATALALSPPQRTAIERLTSGHTVVSSAVAAGVSRSTLHRWMKEDATFQAAYNAWQRDAVVTARGRILALTDTAVTALGKAMEKGDGRLAMRLLEKMGLTAAPEPGATEAEEVKREQAMEARRVEVERKKAESELVLDEMLPGL